MIFALQTGPAATRDLLSVAADISVVLVGILAVVAIFAVVLLLGHVRRLGRELEGLVRGLNGKADPMLEHGRGIAANVEFISATVRSDVERLAGSVNSLSDRLQQASERMEERIEDFNALMEVLQGEAEGLFLDTASTVRGVRASANGILGAAAAGASYAGPEEGEAAGDGAPGTPRQLDEGAEPAEAAEAVAPEA